jgi:hypothetical protein
MSPFAPDLIRMSSQLAVRVPCRKPDASHLSSTNRHGRPESPHNHRPLHVRPFAEPPRLSLRHPERSPELAKASGPLPGGQIGQAGHGRHHDRRMSVMAAGVHHAIVSATILHLLGVLNRQSVHVGSQGDPRSVISGGRLEVHDQPQDPRDRDGPCQSSLSRTVSSRRVVSYFAPGQFGIHVQLSAEGDPFGLTILNQPVCLGKPTLLTSR